MQFTEIADFRVRLDAARAALLEARWDAALDALHECEDWSIDIAEYAVLVKADTLMRRDAAAALAWLATTNDIVATEAARFERELLTGRAFANARNFHGAEVRFERARRFLGSVPEGAPKLAYQLARLKWFRREAKPDDADLAIALTDPDPTGRAAAYSVRSWAYAGVGNYRAQIDDLARAMEIAAAAQYRCDVAVMGIIVHTLARISFEIADARGVTIARTAFDNIQWTDDVRVDKFQTLRALGLDAFMHGEVARAQWLFRDAAVAAPTPAFKAFAHLDRAYVARISHNEPWALDEIDEAHRIAAGISWGQTFGEERIALVMLAVLLAPVDAAEAQRYAATYSMVGVENVSPTLALSQERRAVAGEMFALARIDQMLGNDEAAIGALHRAYDVYAPIDHHYQAMMVATALAEITGEAVWAERAKEHIGKYPGCPLVAERVDAVVPLDAVLSGLSPLQRQIARAHWSGLEVLELSKRFSRSLYTIERQVSAIYKAFGVASAAALRHEALRRGLA
ncbi:MAG: hypothetical protein NVS2B17_25480 [Candidatus Velthaea sp.]